MKKLFKILLLLSIICLLLTSAVSKGGSGSSGGGGRGGGGGGRSSRGSKNRDRRGGAGWRPIPYGGHPARSSASNSLGLGYCSSIATSFFTYFSFFLIS
ncbi:hypothetical protein MTR67_017142 [Solanum verrucosum]|uniref:Glycine-rich protein n=1 Tax=Solanum verrucosum TaxID=315347 RepID=A0AAF0QHE8_SOLVR|nr:hypothetical protein MTR67_017142 [Solanum verrucosum]